MTIEAGRKYTVLEFPLLNSDRIMAVKVRRIYDNPERGKIVEYVYNWPFPIVEHQALKMFEQRIAIVSR